MVLHGWQTAQLLTGAKKPNGRTEERKRDLWIRQSPPEVKAELCSRHRVSRLQAKGWMSENQILLADRKKYFCLDIPFYRTLATVLGNHQVRVISHIPTAR